MKDGVASGAHAVIFACLARIESIQEPMLLYAVTVRVSCTSVVQEMERPAFEPIQECSNLRISFEYSSGIESNHGEEAGAHSSRFRLSFNTRQGLSRQKTQLDLQFRSFHT